jgi:hypothetical protein
MTEHTTYRLAMLLPDSRQLLGIVGSSSVELPRISVPKQERAAEQLTTLVEDKWQIKTVVLDVLRDASASTPCAIMEVRTATQVFRCNGLVPVQLHSISEASLRESESCIVTSVLAGDVIEGNPFARLNWVDDVQQWIRKEIHDHDVRFTDDISHFNAGGGFSLVRFGTVQGPAYWLKAVGVPNLHEFGITKALAERLPNYLPPIVAMRDDWNAWITKEAGSPLSDSFTLPSVQSAVIALAKLQRDSVEHRDALRVAGCTDCSITVLEAKLRDITEHLEEAMSRQTSTKEAPLEAVRLHELEQILREACSRMQDLCIPDTLIHNDINAGNILLSDSRCFFIDWAEGLTGNPLMTFQHICAQVLRNDPDADRWLQEIRSSYRAVWLDMLSETQINRAYALMPILALVSYLYGNGAWLSSAERDLPHFQAHSRSLARYIDRAARTLKLKEAVCH